jgi:hypothetical protein
MSKISIGASLMWQAAENSIRSKSFDRDEATDDLVHMDEFTAELTLGLGRKITKPGRMNPPKGDSDAAEAAGR